MPVCMVFSNVECPASGVGEYHLPLCGVTTFYAACNTWNRGMRNGKWEMENGITMLQAF